MWMLYRFGGGGRVERDGGLSTQVADLGERSVQVRGRLGVEDQHVTPGRHIALGQEFGLHDHKVRLERNGDP